MATTTTTSGGTVTSLSNTPQATDDIFTTGVIGTGTATITEDLLGVMYLNVMSNDLGGSAKTLWSLDNATSLSTATKVYAPADLLIQDTGRIEATSTDTSFNGAKIWITADGKVGYDAATLSTTFKAQLQSLAAGGSLTDSFTYAIRLGNGTLSWATAQVQFAGMNDSVTMNIGVQAGTVTEDATTTSSPTDSLSTTGTIAFSDVDLSDTHTASFVAAGGNATALGNFALAPVTEAANAADGTVNWTYTLNNAAAQYLAQGQTATETYVVTISDGHGSSTTQNVMITISGTNDQVQITSGVQTGDAGEDSGDYAASGSITFTDVDLIDTHSVTVTPGASGYLGSFTTNPLSDSTGTGSGSLGWNFAVDNAAVQFLGEGESVTQIYNVAIGDGAVQTVTITITGTNDQPTLTIVDGTGAMSEGNGTATLSNSGALSFADLDSTDTVTVSQTANGDIGWSGGTLNASVASALVAGFSVDQNSWDYSSNQNLDFLGAGETITFSYAVVVTDDSGATNAASAGQTVTITITGTNDAPVLSFVTGNDAGAVQEDTTLSVSGQFGSADIDHAATATWSIAGADTGSYGSIAVDSTGQWTYTLANGTDGIASAVQSLKAGESHDEVFSVQVSDGLGGVDTQSVTITVTGTNDAPVLSFVTGNDAGAVQEDTTLSVSGQFSSADIDHAATTTWSIAGTNTGTYGSIAVDNAGKWTYTLANGTDGIASAVQSLGAGESHDEVFSVQVSDGLGGVDTQLVTVTVSGTNDAPVLSFATGNDAGAAQEDTTLSVSGQFGSTDIDHAATTTWSIAGTNTGTYGSIAVDNAGKWTYTLANGTDGIASAVQSLGAGESHDEVFSVQVSDGLGGVDTQLVTVTVTGTNDAAVLSADIVNLTETDAALTTNGSLTISDIDSAATFVAQTNTAGSYGKFSIGAGGAWTYVADSAHNEFVAGTTYTDTFAVSSADGTLTSVTVHILGTNDAAVLSADIANLTETNAPLTTSGSLTISDVDSAATFVTQTNTAGSYGQFSIGVGGAWTYVADSAHNEFVAGTTYTDTFAVSSADGTLTSVTVHILGTNDAAVLSADIAHLTETDAPLSTSGTLTISDVDSAATFVAQTNTAGSYGQFSIGVGGAWTYVADSAHNEFVAGTTYTDTFAVSSADGTLTSVTVHILGTNDAAVLSADIANLTETDAPLSTSGTLTISDVDSATTFVTQTNTAGSYGQFSIGVGGAWTYVADSAHNEFVAGTTYTDTFAVSSADGTLTSVTVHITGSNDAAVLSSASLTLTETNAPLTTSGSLTVSDVDSPETFQAQSGTAGANGTFAINTAGNWSYTANSAFDALNVGDSLTDTFTVLSADGTATAVTVSINGSNDAAVLSSASITLTETDAPLTTNGSLTISDVDSPETFQAQSGTAGTNGTFAINTAGNWSYTANSAFDSLNVGDSLTDTFTVLSADGTATAVTVSITGSNDAAVLSSASVTLTETNAPLTTNGSLTISDVDSAATFVAQTNTAGSYGQFSIGAGGAWSYVADSAHNEFVAGTTYTDTFVVSSADGTLTSVTVQILGTNDAPVMAAGGSLPYTENQAATTINSALTVTDVDSSNLTGATVSITGNFAAGQDVLTFTNQNGITGSYNAGTGVLILTGVATVAQYQAALRSVTYSNSSDNPATATRTISFQVDDGAAANHASNIATTTVTVAAVNDAPTTSGLTITETSISFVATDPDNATLSLQSPFAAAFGNPSITSGASTSLSPVEQGSVVSGTLQVKDGSVAASVVELYLGTSAGNNFAAGSSDTAIYGFGGTDNLSGGAGADWIFGGAGNDVIVGSANDRLLDGGTGTDTFNVAGTFVDTSDGQIANFENVALLGSGVLILNAQTESFTIFGTSGVDQIVAGSGNDTIFGTDNDTLLNGGTGSDTLGTGPLFTSTSDGQITGIENVFIATAATLNLSNQTEGFTITGSSGADTITGGTGADSISTAGGNDIINGAQNDTLLDGGANTDTLNVSANFTSTSNAQIANIENVTLTTPGLTLNLGNQTEAFNINGSSGIDSISGGSGADTINGQAGNDTLTGNGGADQFRLRTNGGTDTIADYTDNTDKIGFLDGAGAGGVNFTTVASSAGTTLFSTDFQTRNSINNINNNDDNNVNVIDASSQSTSQITTGIAGSATNTYVIVFNSTTGKGEIWFDTDWSNTASRVQVATLNNVTTLAGVANITASDIVVHDSTLGPAGIAGSPINLGLADAVTRADVTTVTISGLPAGWTLNQGTDNGNGTWTVDKGSLDTLTVTTPADFVGARVLPVTMTWTNADGTVESEVIRDNVEAYAPGSPIFALSADDNLTGSSGADQFVFAQPIGNNVIHSFDTSADKIDLIGFAGVTGFADLSITNDAIGNALVSISSGQTVTLKGVDAADLSEANFQFDVDPVMTNTGTLIIADGAIMPFGGSIHNSGTIELGSTGSETNLEILFRGATLTGGGQVLLSDSAQNVIFGGSADTVLTNADNRISGAGQLGAGQMVLVNAGLILASGLNSLVLDTGTHTITNSGVLESTGAGGMTVASAVENSGHLWANGGDMRLLADVMGNGSATIDGDATLIFAGAAHGSVAFHGEGAGSLVIAQAEAAGSLVGILGLESDDMLTFGDLAFGANTQLSYSANASGAGGLLTVDDGTHRAEVNLLGHYTVEDFQLTDGEAGTQVSYNGASSGTLVGSMAADVLSGGDGNDILAGRGGEDTLSGGAGADMFAYLNANEGGDSILDYNFAEGDALDLSALLSANFVSGVSQASDFVQLAQSGSDITVKVDADGTANGTNFADVAVLANTGTSGTDLVRTWFGEADHTLTA